MTILFIYVGGDKFQKEKIMSDLLERWEQTGLLEGLSENTAIQCCNMLESQRLYNEAFSDFLPASWLRTSIPVVRRIISQCSYSDGQCIIEGGLGITKNWHECKTPVPSYFLTKWMHEDKSSDEVKKLLDEEAELTATLSKSLSDEITTCVKENKFSTLYFI